MSNDTNMENQKEINRMHTKYSLAFLAIAVVLSLLLGAGAGALGTVAVIDSKTTTKEKAALVEAKSEAFKAKDLKKKVTKAAKAEEMKKESERAPEYPTYTVNLYEEPIVTMWEFAHALEDRDAAGIGIAQTSLDNENTNYDIMLLKEKSLISDGYNYYLAIQGRWTDEALCMKVTKVTIDDVWNTLVHHINDWNEMTEQEDFAPVDYNKFDALMSHLRECVDEYEMKKIPASSFVAKGELLTPNV